jgi:hypothetical protein
VGFELVTWSAGNEEMPRWAGPGPAAAKSCQKLNLRGKNIFRTSFRKDTVWEAINQKSSKNLSEM